MIHVTVIHLYTNSYTCEYAYAYIQIYKLLAFACVYYACEGKPGALHGIWDGYSDMYMHWQICLTSELIQQPDYNHKQDMPLNDTNGPWWSAPPVSVNVERFSRMHNNPALLFREDTLHSLILWCTDLILTHRSWYKANIHRPTSTYIKIHYISCIIQMNWYSS